MPLSKDSSFCSLYCARKHCSRARFPSEVFRATVPPNRQVLVMALQMVRPSLFRLDFELAEAVGGAASMAEFEHAVLLHYGGIRERNWLRDRLKFRISLHRLRKLAQGYLPKV